MLGPMVVTHLVIILIAAKNGLTGEEILSRTSGNEAWAVFYFLFVLAAAAHAPIGLRSIMREWTALKDKTVNMIALLFAVFVLFAGLRAVAAIY